MTAAVTDPRATQGSASVLRSSVLMAAGSTVSRATGFVRSAVVVAALGTGLTGDSYTVANTVPFIIYVLLVGGVLNAVFVPELVRAAKEHPDGGAAYTDRLITSSVLALLALTTAAVLLAPQIVTLYTGYTGAPAAGTVLLARCCLPQILFYGLFTLLGQVLNARDRFGAMMWTPVLNNLVVMAVFGTYLAFGLRRNPPSTTELLLLGCGTTAGIAVQALALAFSLRQVRFRWRPRFDWRGSGLSRPLRSAGWLVGLVLTNQIAYWAVTRLSVSAGMRAVAEGLPGGAGISAYSNAYLVWAVPHGIITVSLVTALLPRMSAAAADGDPARIRADIGYGLRASASVIVPAAALLFSLAPWLMGALFGYGASRPADIRVMAGILMALAPGLIAFSGQYVVSRGFYALSDTRTPFFLNLVGAAVQTVVAFTAHLVLPPRWTVTGIAAATSVGLVAGFVVSSVVLARRLSPDGRLPGPCSQVSRTHARLLAVCLPVGAIAWAAAGAVARAGAGDVAATAAGTLVVVGAVALVANPLPMLKGARRVPR
ncbi:murein biosynthesis integral membrane protein MurJ [Streptomyces vinaceus]|uniref:murein biosynthesis integral membrane protein MurJ n=1 Tax=Streptomyces vinaceus TaxID=1960 RepID=UPI0038207B2E